MGDGENAEGLEYVSDSIRMTGKHDQRENRVMNDVTGYPGTKGECVLVRVSVIIYISVRREWRGMVVAERGQVGARGGGMSNSKLFYICICSLYFIL